MVLLGRVRWSNWCGGRGGSDENVVATVLLSDCGGDGHDARECILQEREDKILEVGWETRVYFMPRDEDRIEVDTLKSTSNFVSLQIP